MPESEPQPLPKKPRAFPAGARNRAMSPNPPPDDDPRHPVAEKDHAETGTHARPVESRAAQAADPGPCSAVDQRTYRLRKLLLQRTAPRPGLERFLGSRHVREFLRTVDLARASAGGGEIQIVLGDEKVTGRFTGQVGEVDLGRDLGEQLDPPRQRRPAGRRCISGSGCSASDRCSSATSITWERLRCRTRRAVRRAGRRLRRGRVAFLFPSSVRATGRHRDVSGFRDRSLRSDLQRLSGNRRPAMAALVRVRHGDRTVLEWVLDKIIRETKWKKPHDGRSGAKMAGRPTVGGFGQFDPRPFPLSGIAPRHQDGEREAGLFGQSTTWTGLLPIFAIR
jgi:hypothetical protein